METKPTALHSFKCRKCRHLLFSYEDLSPAHAQLSQCSSWYLKDDDLLPWVQVLVDESGWTEGKLYCPKCNGRVGGFDFLHVVHCSCLVGVIPAIWCPKSRVDIASKFVRKSLHGQEMNTEGNCNIESGNDPLLTEENNRNSIHDATVNSPSGAGSVFETEMQSAMIKAHSSPRCTTKSTSSEMEQSNLNAVCCQNLESVGFSCCNCSKLGCKMVSKGASMEMKSLQHCCSCKSNSITDNCDSGFPCHCGTDFLSCANSNVSDSHTSVRNIQEELIEIRREVENLCPSRYSDGNSMNREFIGKRRRKPRRRGRCNWQHGTDILNYTKEMKDNTNLNDHIDIGNVPVTRHKLHQNFEEEKELSDSELPDYCKCSVCLSLLHEPLKTPCQHVFCTLCIKQLNHVSKGRPKCPLCREPIRNVEADEDLETEIQVSFPVNYRKRAKETKRNRYRKSALPTPNSTMFDSRIGEENQGNNFEIIRHLTIIALAISLLINGLLVNHHGNPVVRANLQRNVTLFVFIVVGCMFASLFLLCLMLFAFDFVKIALFLVLSYVAVIKLALGNVLN